MTDDTAVATRPEAPELTPFEVIEQVITSGDLQAMTPAARVAFYWRTCESLGLNPLTRPFQFLNLGGKIVMYATKDATDQLRAVNHVSVTKLERERVDDLAMVTAYGRDRYSREDSAIGAVSIAGLRGDALANAWMKAETKAKRRMTLSLVGLGFLDESEVEGLGTPVEMNEAGEIADKPKPSLLEAVQTAQAALDPQVVEITTTEGSGKPLETEPVVVSPLRSQEAILSEPMSVEESAARPLEDDATARGTDEEQPSDQQLGNPPPAGLTVQELAALAKGKVNKQGFATALDCEPADVGKHIEAMTDQQRHDLAHDLGLL